LGSNHWEDAPSRAWTALTNWSNVNPRRQIPRDFVVPAKADLRLLDRCSTSRIPFIHDTSLFSPPVGGGRMVAPHPRCCHRRGRTSASRSAAPVAPATNILHRCPSHNGKASHQMAPATPAKAGSLRWPPRRPAAPPPFYRQTRPSSATTLPWPPLSMATAPTHQTAKLQGARRGSVACARLHLETTTESSGPAAGGRRGAQGASGAEAASHVPMADDELLKTRQPG